jgi:hypothetical protein
MNKFINNILEMLGVLIITVGLGLVVYTYLDGTYMYVGYGVSALLGITIYFISISYEKRLERELEAYKDSVLVYDMQLGEKNKQVLLLEDELHFLNKSIDGKNNHIKDLNSKIDKQSNEITRLLERISILEQIPNDVFEMETDDDLIPFSEGIIQCSECGSDNMRETKCYYICNECGKRVKK